MRVQESVASELVIIQALLLCDVVATNILTEGSGISTSYPFHYAKRGTSLDPSSVIEYCSIESSTVLESTIKPSQVLTTSFDICPSEYGASTSYSYSLFHNLAVSNYGFHSSEAIANDNDISYHTVFSSMNCYDESELSSALENYVGCGIRADIPPSYTIHYIHGNELCSVTTLLALNGVVWDAGTFPSTSVGTDITFDWITPTGIYNGESESEITHTRHRPEVSNPYTHNTLTNNYLEENSYVITDSLDICQSLISSFS